MKLMHGTDMTLPLAQMKPPTMARGTKGGDLSATTRPASFEKATDESDMMRLSTRPSHQTAQHMTNW